MAALELDDTPLAPLPSPFAIPEEGIGLSDYGRLLAQGTYGLGANVAGAVDYATRGAIPEWGQLRDRMSAGAAEQQQAMSPGMQRAMGAGVLPGDGPTIWDDDVSTGHAIAGRVTQAVPSLIASLVPGGLVARGALAVGAGRAAAASAGTTAGGVSAGVQTGGDVFNRIMEDITREPDDKLKEASEVYRGLRNMGMPEVDAKDLIVRQAAGSKPLIMAAITALTSRYGVEGMVAHRAAGQAGRGLLRGTALGMVGEAAQEGVEELSGELLGQQGVFDAKGGSADYDWRKALEAAAQGALVGGVMGGAVGAATSGRRQVVSDRPIDVDNEAALAPAPTPPPRVVTPEVTPTGPEVTLDTKQTTPGQELDALDKTVKDSGANAGVVERVDTPAAAPAAPAGVGVDEAAALAQYDPELGEDPDAFIPEDMEPSDTPLPTPSVPDVSVVSPQMQQAITTPAPVPAAVQPAEPRLEPGPGEPAEVRAPAQLAPEPATTPALEPAPAAPRILENLKQKPRMGKLKKAQIEAGVKPEEVLSAKELRAKARQDELAGLAERVRAAQAKLPEPDASKGAPAARAYARELVAAAEIGNVKLGNLAQDADPALRLLKAAVQIGKGVGKASDAIALAGTDIDVRKGATAGPRYVGGASFNEDIGESEGTKGGAVRNEAEEEVTEEIDAKRAAARRAELDKAAEEAKAKARAEAEKKTAAAMQNLVAGEAKRPVMVERKRVVTPPGKRENLFERRKREAEEKEREAAAEVERTRKRRETDREKGIEEMMALMQERDEILAGKTDFADAMLPAQDMADKIVAVQRGLETKLGSQLAASQAYRSAVQQHEHRKKQAAGDATATTPAAAVAQLREQRAEENRDVLPRRPEDEAAARELDQIMGPKFDRQGPLKDLLKKKLLDDSFDDAPVSDAYRLLMHEMAGRIRKLAGDVPIRIVDDRTFTEIWAERSPDDVGSLPQGFYDSNTDEIVVRIDQLDAPLLIHEGLHAAYMHALEDHPAAFEQTRLLMNAVARQIIKEAAANGQTTVKMPYGMTDEHEFISEAFSNREFQELLIRTPMDPAAGAQARGFKRALISVWDAIIRNVKKAVFKDGGPSIGILEQVIRVTQQLDTHATQQRRQPMTWSLAPSRRGSGPTVNVQEAMAAMGQNVADRGAGVDKWWHRAGLKLRTLDQIVRGEAHLFDRARGEGNPLQRIYNALSEQTVFVDKKRKEGQEWAQRFKELEQSAGRDVMNRAASLMIDATMADVNLGPGADNSHLGKDAARYYQNKAQLARLEQQFESLPQEVRSFILDSAAYYRTTQNEMTRALISNVLQAHAPTLSPQAYAQLTTNTMNGTLGDADAAIIDNDTVFKALRDAAGLRVIKGIYFPLMRHGNHVVRTLERLGDLHGGKVVETDKDGNVVLEFTAPKDSAARKMYKAFADSTTAKITSVGKRRYLPDGTVVSAQDATGRTHDVAYRVRVQRRGVHFFDTAKQATAFIREQGPTYESVSPKAMDRADMEARGDLTNAQFAAIMSSLDRRTDLAPDEKGILVNALREASVRLMSGNRVQHRSIARRNVHGASDDIARNTVQYATAASNYLGKLRYMPKVNAALADMRELQDREKDHVDEAARGQVLNELKARIDRNVINVQEPPQFVKDIMTLSFMDKLFSPMYSAVNGMQPWMVTLPVLSGHYGVLRSAAAIGRAYNSVGAGGLVWSGAKDTATAARQIASIGLDTTDLVGSIRQRVAKETDGAALNRLIDDLVETGQISPDAGFELAGAISAGRGPGGVALAKVERIARQMPLAIEAINRAATAVATYRLGRSAGMTEEQAIAHAKDMVDKTQGNYNTFNQPRIFNHPLASPALQFKKYAQLMSALMIDMVKKASFGTKQEKKIALKQIGALLSVQMAMAGAMGLPGLELLKVGFMVASMLGMGDGWEDMERKLRKTFENAVGKTPAELVTRGVISRGIAQFVPFPDLSTRVSLSDMWTFGEPKSTDRQGAMAYLFNLVGGAPASLALDWMEAGQHASRGEFQDAFIKIVPAKFVADTAKAVKLRGQRDITDAEFVIQTLGARSARMAEKGDEVGGKVAISKKLESDRKLLTREYLAAGSASERLKIKARIVAHNRRAEETRNNRQRVGTTGLDAVRADKEKERRALQGD
jgi:hypothetical protein